ncbi:MAG: putative resolvase [Mycobacterium sp.]|nr:putative resolvase [Mycobacterium sp.]
MNLADWAESVGVNRHTAYRWFREGTLLVPVEGVGRLILVRTAPAGDGGVVMYARVCSHDQRADLDRRVSRLTVWVTDQDLTVRQVVVQVGLGLYGKRPKLRRINVGPGCEGDRCGAS